ncbi:hypothetical protein ACX3YG_07415 [Pseudomonas wadenswilerensis]
MSQRILPILIGATLVLLGGSVLAADENNPRNSPIRQINPNSQQGTVPDTPPVRGPSTLPSQRPPTLENRGIGNGDNLRREQQTPRLEPIRPPRDSQRAP